MGSDSLTLAALNAAAALAVVAAVVVTEFDLRKVTGRLAGTGRKAVYRTTLSAFLLLVGFGQGFQVFNLIFAFGRAFGPVETLTQLGWGLLAGWTIAVRPFARSEILCHYAAACPVVRSERQERRGNGNRGEVVEPALTALGVSRVMKAAPERPAGDGW